jgi:hypothetical protein
MTRSARDEAARRAHQERFERESRPVLDALAAAGLRVGYLPDLVNRDIDYDAQVPVLIDWLPRVAYAPVKSTVARALTVRAARPAAADVLLDELRRAPAELPPAPDDTPLEERWRRSDTGLLRQSLGNALAFTADRSHFDAIVELIEDPGTGAARPFLIELYLARFRGLGDRAVPVLRRLLADDDLGRYALKPLAKLRAVEARAEVERFLTHPQDWVRSDAERTLRIFESIQFES